MEPTRFVVRIEWDSLDAGTWRASGSTRRSRDFFALVRPYVDDIEETHHYEVRPLSGRAREGTAQPLRLGRRAAPRSPG